jgi:hypothetical protein
MLSQVQSSHDPSHTPPEYQKLSGVEWVIASTIALSEGGRSTATSHCTAPGRRPRRCPPERAPALRAGTLPRKVPGTAHEWLGIS